MNERIQDLAKKAGFEYDPQDCNFYQSDSAQHLNIQIDKFAELIVRECAQLCRDQPNVYAMKADRDNCAIAIEEHFGVEE